MRKKEYYEMYNMYLMYEEKHTHRSSKKYPQGL